MITKKYINQLPCVGLNYFEQVNCKNHYETEKLTLTVYFKNENYHLFLRCVSGIMVIPEKLTRDVITQRYTPECF